MGLLGRFCLSQKVSIYSRGAYLIFVTDPTDISVKKKCVMWRNLRFLCMTDVENSEISPHME